MSPETFLKRFVNAQRTDYATALSEIRRGQKVTHWMWFIFPQIQGLGSSETSKYYAIKNIGEAQAFLQHPVLGPRLTDICHALLHLNGNDATRIFGSPDDLKLKSSMTLFASLLHADPVFQQVLDRFFEGATDRHTMEILEDSR